MKLSLRYLLFALGVLGLLGMAEWRGFSFLSVSEARTGPRSVRDNPGAYRPHYGGYGRYTGGK